MANMSEAALASFGGDELVSVVVPALGFFDFASWHSNNVILVAAAIGFASLLLVMFGQMWLEHRARQRNMKDVARTLAFEIETIFVQASSMARTLHRFGRESQPVKAPPLLASLGYSPDIYLTHLGQFGSLPGAKKLVRGHLTLRTLRTLLEAFAAIDKVLDEVRQEAVLTLLVDGCGELEDAHSSFVKFAPSDDYTELLWSPALASARDFVASRRGAEAAKEETEASKEKDQSVPGGSASAP